MTTLAQLAAVQIPGPLSSAISAHVITLVFDVPGGVPLLNAQSRITLSMAVKDDVIVDDSVKGYVMLDNNSHYWRLTITSCGNTVTTDLGTVLP